MAAVFASAAIEFSASSLGRAAPVRALQVRVQNVKTRQGNNLPDDRSRLSAGAIALVLFCFAIDPSIRLAFAESITPAAPAAGGSNPPGTTSVAKRSTPYPTVHPLPPMDPRKVLSLPALKAAMRHGGLVFYLRHTENGVITPQCESSNLTPRGEADARQIGKAIRDLKLPIGKIFSSDICRVRDTARLLDLGAFEITEDLTNVPKREGYDIHTARMKLLATVPPAGTHHLLVSHIHGGDREDQAIYLDLGEIIVFRPNGRGGADAVARIRIEDWKNYPAAGNTGTDLPTR